MPQLTGPPELRLRRAPVVVTPVTLDDLLAGLLATPGARAVPAAAPLRGAVVAAGVEVAGTDLADDRSLRRAWRDRHGGGATPLLLVADEPGRTGCVRALGLVDPAAPIRTVDVVALASALARLASMPRLEAVRELAAELDRLDQAGIPGLKLRDLLTVHTLNVRLRGDAMRWAALQEAVKAIAKGADWRGILTTLGYDVVRRPVRGWLVRFDGRPVAVVHPRADPSEFARLADDGRPPEGILLNDCAAEGVSYGLLASGSRVRLFDAAPLAGSAAARYIDLDAAVLQDDDRAYLGLLAPAYLAEDRFAALQREARDYGAALRIRLDQAIRQRALPALGLALGRWAKSHGSDPTDEDIREDLERAALTLVFRGLFILYAEAAGYLPMDSRAYEESSLTRLVEEAADGLDDLDPRSTSLWDRFTLLVKAMRTGNRSRAWGVPAYNGALFAADGFEGAAILERAELADPDFARVLVGIGRPPGDDVGLDYSTLEIGHLGNIYEGLLSLRLSVAESPLTYNARADRYEVAAEDGPPDVEVGDLLWQTHEGGRKGGGVYYTRSELVRHLVRHAVSPAFEAHLARVRALAATDPVGAAEELFDFAVLDPACGSAHFLVVVVAELADRVVRFLGESPLPAVAAAIEHLRAGASAGAAIDDVALLRRLVTKRCVFGVDLSPMGAEVAKLSLWLASFVPGLSLAYLDRNVQVGNSLVGVLDLDGIVADSALFQEPLRQATERAVAAVREVASGQDRSPDEVRESEGADIAARDATAGLERLCDIWTAGSFGIEGAQDEARFHAAEIVAGTRLHSWDGLDARPGQEGWDEIPRLMRGHRFLHWLTAFPQVFGRERPGFDAVVGNPPWEEVTVEALAFYGLFRPGIRSLPEGDRAVALDALLALRPELAERLARARQRSAAERGYLAAAGYPSMPGDPDLYKFFCARYQALLRNGGRLGVVLPRSAFSASGSAGFREWLFAKTTCHRLDFLVNSGRWAFDSEPRYTVALVAAERAEGTGNHRTVVAGTAMSLAAWEDQAASAGLALAPEAFGPHRTVPLLRTQTEADLLAKLRLGSPFPRGPGGRWRNFAVAELHETNDKKLWRDAETGQPLWKGESFDQYDPHGAGSRCCPPSDALLRKIRKPRPGTYFAPQLRARRRAGAVLKELSGARVAFRDVSRATDSRTVRAALIPPGVLLTNKAPYLAFVEGGNEARAATLAIMNSLPFDWQARRFVEVNLNFFILEGLVVPDLDEATVDVIADCAARLSCIDQRFDNFAGSFGIEPGPLPDEERERLRVEIDARVAAAWGLTGSDLDVLLADFTADAVPPAYRRLLSHRLGELTGGTP
ncbi:MAG: Eco57I restriction-modification methylase domain-containing protein [Acidimicrobiales bacterium]